VPWAMHIKSTACAYNVNSRRFPFFAMKICKIIPELENEPGLNIDVDIELWLELE
jgi:hypothetical protein